LKDIRFTGERYEAGLPWIEDRPEIGSDFDLCYNRLKLFHRKLKKQPEYNKCIEDQIRRGLAVWHAGYGMKDKMLSYRIQQNFKFRVN
jgi:hypothetical protein